MAKTSYQLIPPELDALYSRSLMSGERYIIPRVRRKVLFLSRNRIKGLTEKSLIPSLSLVWNGLTTTSRDLWTSTGALSNLSGFRHFLKDKAFRIKNDISGYAMPNTYHQVEVGLLRVESPATGLKIEQLHPLNYWVQRKVTGTKSQYQPVSITESFDLPLEISINYKSDLTSVGSGAFAKFYCIVYSHYQGRIIETPCEISMPLSHNWATLTASITSVIGMVRGYTAFLEIYNATGDLLIDNLSIEHSGQNWCRDPFCNDINQSFTKAFYQIPKHWAAVDVPEGAYFESVYYHLDTLEPPYDLHANTITHNYVTLHWSLGDTYTSQKVYRSTNGTTFSSQTTISGSATTNTRTSLTPNTHYWFKIEGINGAQTVFSEVFDFYTLPAP